MKEVEEEEEEEEGKEALFEHHGSLDMEELVSG